MSEGLRALCAFLADGGDLLSILVVEEYYGTSWDVEEYVLAGP